MESQERAKFKILHLGGLEAFARRLREERIRLGLTQRELAQIGGVRRGSQILYEKGAHPPTVEYLMRIADAGVEISHLIPNSSSAPTDNAVYISKREHDRISIRRADLIRALELADKIGRDRRGRLLGFQARSALTQRILQTVSAQPEDEVAWDAIERQLKNQITGK